AVVPFISMVSPLKASFSIATWAGCALPAPPRNRDPGFGGANVRPRLADFALSRLCPAPSISLVHGDCDPPPPALHLHEPTGNVIDATRTASSSIIGCG